MPTMHPQCRVVSQPLHFSSCELCLNRHAAIFFTSHGSLANENCCCSPPLPPKQPAWLQTTATDMQPEAAHLVQCSPRALHSSNHAKVYWPCLAGILTHYIFEVPGEKEFPLEQIKSTNPNHFFSLFSPDTGCHCHKAENAKPASNFFTLWCNLHLFAQS